MREIVFDTETTGLDPFDGHRIVEIGCVELDDHFPTGRTLQLYMNPERDIPIESERVHGLSAAFLADKPLFGEVADEFLAFVEDSPLVIHNASFDMKFINAELARVGRAPIPFARTIDTIEIAKRKHPGARYSLDELCKRFGVDLSARTKHGALLDAQLTAEIYLELIGGRQRGLMLSPAEGREGGGGEADMHPARPRPTPLAPRVSEEEQAAHAAFIAREFGDKDPWTVV